MYKKENFLYKISSPKARWKNEYPFKKWTNGQGDGQLYVQKKMS